MSGVEPTERMIEMGEWKEYKLGDVTTKIGSGATPTGGENSYKPEGIAFIRSQNVLDFQFSYNGLAYIDDEQADALRNVTVESGDILLNITGDSVARVCKVPDRVLPARVNQHVSIVRAARNSMDNNYLLYFLQYKKEHLLSISEIGATRRALTKGIIEDLEIELPDLLEQKSIASVLSSLDDKIDLLHGQNKTLEALAETLFRQWFVEEAEKGWKNGVLSYLCITITKGTTPTTLGHQFTESGINFIKAESITDSGDFIIDKLSKISEDTHNFLNRSIIQDHDVLCSIAGTIGRIAIVTKDILPANTNQAIAILRINKEKCFPEFVYLFLKSSQFKEIMDGKIVHAVQPNLSLGEIGNTEIRIPPQELLKQFKQLVMPLFKKKYSNNTQIHILTRLRDTLLPKLMSGEVRVKD